MPDGGGARRHGTLSDALRRRAHTLRTRASEPSGIRLVDKLLFCAGVTFIPADASHSLNVWFTDANAPGNTTGQHQLNGSMDFFIRINKPLTDWDQLRILNCSHDHRVKDRGIQFVPSQLSSLPETSENLGTSSLRLTPCNLPGDLCSFIYLFG